MRSFVLTYRERGFWGGVALQGAKRMAKKAGTPFRRFSAPSGATVLVGRNNRQNDELSTKVAAPNDVWMHARLVPGAHVVLR